MFLCESLGLLYGCCAFFCCLFSTATRGYSTRQLSATSSCRKQHTYTSESVSYLGEDSVASFTAPRTVLTSLSACGKKLRSMCGLFQPLLYCKVFLSCSFARHHTVVDPHRLFNTLHVGSASGQTRDRRVNAHRSFIEQLALANNLQLHVCISSNPPGVTLVPGVHDRGLQKGDIPFRPTF